MSASRELADLVSESPSTDLNLDNNTLFVDVSENRVGIGTTNPTQTLHVDGTVGGTAVLDEDDLASDSDTQIATQQSIKAFVTSGTVVMENKTLTSPVINTGVSGTAFIDDDTFGTATSTNFASAESIKAYIDAQIAANSGGSVNFKGTINSTSLPSGTVPAGKTWIAFGYSTSSTSSSSTTGGGNTSNPGMGYGYGYGYGFGQALATKTGSSSWTTMVPAGTATYQYYIEMDNG